jgi:hypothetical protein
MVSLKWSAPHPRHALTPLRSQIVDYLEWPVLRNLQATTISAYRQVVRFPRASGEPCSPTVGTTGRCHRDNHPLPGVECLAITAVRGWTALGGAR